MPISTRSSPKPLPSTGAASIKDMGKVMGVVKGKAAGKADMGAVGARIKAQAGRLSSALGGRGIATAGALILIALICISISRKIETERRELGRFPSHRLPLVIGGVDRRRSFCILVAQIPRHPSLNAALESGHGRPHPQASSTS